MKFIIVLFIIALAIASVAAYFSIIGLASIFTATFWPVVIMGIVLEAGKLVAASYVYRYWSIISFFMKTYLIGAVIVLMLITSAGIFGMLSTGYQQDMFPIKQKEQQVSLLTQEKTEIQTLKKERLDRRRQIDNDIASLPNNYITGRQRLMESYGPELKQIRKDIATYTVQIREKTLLISELKAKTLKEQAHVGPIIFIAKVFNADVDDATKWLIILIIFAFDPLAVILTIGANIVIVRHQKETGLDIFNTHVVMGQPELRGVQAKELTNIEPEPSITSPEDIKLTPNALKFDNSNVTDINPIIDSIEQLQAMLKDMNQKKDLTPQEVMEKEQIEHLLRRKEVTERIRNPEKVLERVSDPTE